MSCGGNRGVVVSAWETDDGRFAATIQCYVCGYEKPTTEGFEDEQTTREAAHREWFQAV